MGSCNKCYDTYKISCNESSIWWRDITWSANFHGKHTIKECREENKWKIFLTLLRTCNTKPDVKRKLSTLTNTLW